MSAAAYLPPVAAPPHDPRRLPLDARVGWRAERLDGLAQHGSADGDGANLGLARLAGFDAALTGADGSFGGLVLPRHMAYRGDLGLFLLDGSSHRLRRFDGCACRFIDVSHTGGEGSDPRQFARPGGIAVSGDALLVADTGNARVVVFGVLGYVLRGFWQPPVGQLDAPWQPVDIAVWKGQIAVADPANGAIHRFDRLGRWRGCVVGVGAVHAVAFDQTGGLYAATPERILSVAEGAATELAAGAAALRARFAGSPIKRTPSGDLDLLGLCQGRGNAGLFDLSGNPVAAAAVVPVAREVQGTYRSAALDSRLYRCTWDRVTLDLEVPANTRLHLATYTADTELSVQQLDALPGAHWQQAAAVTATPSGHWDALVRSPPGRYLWLRLSFSGDGVESPWVRRIVLDFPRISLRRYLPAVFGAEPVSADFTDRLLAVFDRGFRSVEQQVDHQARLFDPRSAPVARGAKDFLGWLAGWIGVALDPELPEARRRRVLRNAGRLFQARGTVGGLRAMLGLYLGIDERGPQPVPPCCTPCTVPTAPAWRPPSLLLEHFRLRRWLFVGSGRLGDQARVWGEDIVGRTRLGNEGDGAPSGARLGTTELNTSQDPLRDPFHVYAHRFSVFLPGWLKRAPVQRRAIEALIEAEKPAHTEAKLVYVEPRFRVGVQSMLGYDAVVGAYPQGVVVGEASLGRGRC